jgi:hypothetical protein
MRGAAPLIDKRIFDHAKSMNGRSSTVVDADVPRIIGMISRG